MKLVQLHRGWHLKPVLAAWTKSEEREKPAQVEREEDKKRQLVIVATLRHGLVSPTRPR